MARPKKGTKAELRKCDICGVQFEARGGPQKFLPVELCSPKCRTKYARDQQTFTEWLLVRTLEQAIDALKKKGVDFKIKVDAAAYPGVDEFRPEWNRFGAWIQKEVTTNGGS